MEVIATAVIPTPTEKPLVWSVQFLVTTDGMRRFTTSHTIPFGDATHDTEAINLAYQRYSAQIQSNADMIDSLQSPIGRRVPIDDQQVDSERVEALIARKQQELSRLEAIKHEAISTGSINTSVSGTV
jgi:hypothetical protein